MAPTRSEYTPDQLSRLLLPMGSGGLFAGRCGTGIFLAFGAFLDLCPGDAGLALPRFGRSLSRSDAPIFRVDSPLERPTAAPSSATAYGSYCLRKMSLCHVLRSTCSCSKQARSDDKGQTLDLPFAASGYSLELTGMRT